tara:strand:+ start:817 stop:1035 length:219 start_codon:yes stop_codon:yes gene_type:complete
MKLSTAINKADSVYATVTIADVDTSIRISKPVARKAVDGFLTYKMDEDGHFWNEWDRIIGWYDQQYNLLVIG